MRIETFIKELYKSNQGKELLKDFFINKKLYSYKAIKKETKH